MFSHRLKHFWLEQRGTVLVEMALIVPLMVLLSAGVFEFSNVLNKRLLLEAGVEDAARYMARCSSDWDTCKGRAQNLAANGAVSGGSARLSGWIPTQVEITKTPTAAVDTSTTPNTELYLSSKSTVDVVTVSMSYPYYPDHDLGLWTNLCFANKNITM